jgi:uncharacterized coiled-coil DUF342 family protein
MARKPSIILSPADKKAKVVEIKAQIKDLKAQEKEHLSVIKAATKAATGLSKQLGKLQEELTTLTAKAA